MNGYTENINDDDINDSSSNIISNENDMMDEYTEDLNNLDFQIDSTGNMLNEELNSNEVGQNEEDLIITQSNENLISVESRVGDLPQDNNILIFYEIMEILLKRLGLFSSFSHFKVKTLLKYKLSDEQIALFIEHFTRKRLFIELNKFNIIFNCNEYPLLKNNFQKFNNNEINITKLVNEIFKESNYVNPENYESNIWYFLYKYNVIISKQNIEEFKFSKSIFKTIPKFKNLSKSQVNTLLYYGKYNEIIEPLDNSSIKYKFLKRYL